MTTDIIEVNDFIVMIDSTDSKEAELFNCQFEDDIIGITFYNSGHVDIHAFDDRENKNSTILKSRKGKCISFYGQQGVKFSHNISQKEPLQSVSIFSTRDNLLKLSNNEKALYELHLSELLQTSDWFKSGPEVRLTPEMQLTISKIFSNSFQGYSRLLFMKSQVLELLSHYFSKLEQTENIVMDEHELQKLYKAKEIMENNIHTPPTLNELSKLIGMNNNKLKKNFKQIFGMPVFKYLQIQRLQKAYQLLQNQESTVQEAAWQVGYESLSSFSHAFFKQYGFRPSKFSK
ncbi:helix-turn-helix transcriptional regulator [Flammeovirga agarivorans]|uniref:Helix-turn-helix transcriptional regulator n=1 Tax=Flammeovirga agarivorans TaxID=2726742 RepID=A0A7X8SQ46_9BACT|nr:AraC family transcriptional regulator [Flammeovirga agarivorans]NLR94350.1 helix-turn-helix transcriptional regulator [Flammeovirga agarivorans]